MKLKTVEPAQILESLANGIDPETGEIFPQDSWFNNPVVVRALFLGAMSLNQRSPQGEKPAGRAERLRPRPNEMEGPKQAGKPWTSPEQVRLSAAFKQGKTVEELAVVHGRKVGGIQSRLAKLGLIENWTPAVIEKSGSNPVS